MTLEEEAAVASQLTSFREDQGTQTVYAAQISSRFGWDVQAWIRFVEDANGRPLAEARNMYEEFLLVFPMSVRYWRVYLEREMDAKNFEGVEKLFRRCLEKVPHVQLWQTYLTYCSINASTQEDGNRVLRDAYEYALLHTRHDIESTPIWKDYLHFLKELPTTTHNEINERASGIRETYDRAIATPMVNLEDIWSDYRSWLSSQNKAWSKLADAQSAKLALSRSVYTERSRLAKSLPLSPLAVPPRDGTAETGLKTWKKIIRYEKRNRESRLTPLDLRQQVKYAYKQSLMMLLHYPEMWFDYAKYLIDESLPEEALLVYQQAISYLPGNSLLHFSYADLLESMDRPKEAREVYHALLAVKQDSLIRIQFMFFEHRVSGINAARKVFLKARKDPNCTYHVYIASAMMEFYRNKDAEQARKVFMLALNTEFGSEIDFVVHYLKFLWNLNEVQNTRAMFERVLSSMPPENIKMIWNLYLEFEYACGDANTVAHLERRRAEVYPLDDQNGILALVNRHRYEDLWPCDKPTLDSFSTLWVIGGLGLITRVV